MEIETKNVGQDGMCISPNGELDLYSADRLKVKVLEAFDAKYGALIIDLSQVSYIDSSGVGILLFTFAQSKRRKADIFFAGLQGPVRRVIELTSLLGYLPITESVEEAREFLNVGKS